MVSTDAPCNSGSSPLPPGVLIIAFHHPPQRREMNELGCVPILTLSTLWSICAPSRTYAFHGALKSAPTWRRNCDQFNRTCSERSGSEFMKIVSPSRRLVKAGAASSTPRSTSCLSWHSCALSDFIVHRTSTTKVHISTHHWEASALRKCGYVRWFAERGKACESAWGTSDIVQSSQLGFQRTAYPADRLFHSR